MTDLSNFQNYVEWTDRTAVYPEFSWYPYYGLVSEAGEIAGAIAKYERRDFNGDELKRRVKKELGDVMWMIARILKDNEWTLEEVLADNVKKLEDRLANNKIKGDGDDR